MIGIDFKDAADLVTLVAAAGNPMVNCTVQERRVSLIRSLSETIGADFWNWIWGENNPEVRGDAMLTASFDNGFRDEAERASFFRVVVNPQLMPIVTGPIHDALIGRVSLTRSRSGLICDDDWNAAAVSRIWRDAGFDDFILSAHPISESAYSAIGFHRRVGRPRFTQRDEAIVHLVFQHVRWLHPSEVVPVGRTAISLSARERQVLLYLMDGKSRKEIAKHMRISPHTVSDYLKKIHLKFGVSSRSELLGKFIRNEFGSDC